MALVFSLISGAGWAFGQIITFKAFELVGSSRRCQLLLHFNYLVHHYGAFCAWQLARYNKQNHWISSFTRNSYRCV